MADTSYAFARFMATPTGRGVRILVGLGLIAWGWTMRGQTPGIVLMIVGLVPLLAGMFNVCFIAGLIGVPFSGRKALESGSAPTRQS